MFLSQTDLNQVLKNYTILYIVGCWVVSWFNEVPIIIPVSLCEYDSSGGSMFFFCFMLFVKEFGRHSQISSALATACYVTGKQTVAD